ncbi:hypothetical protein BHE74_00004985 [Ensete ventricosum]|nr:hypothetical protein BHE74_00004985 [Ensete ventricosum]
MGHAQQKRWSISYRWTAKERLVKIAAAAGFTADEHATEGWSPEDFAESAREGVVGRRADPAAAVSRGAAGEEGELSAEKVTIVAGIGEEEIATTTTRATARKARCWRLKEKATAVASEGCDCNFWRRGKGRGGRRTERWEWCRRRGGNDYFGWGDRLRWLQQKRDCGKRKKMRAVTTMAIESSYRGEADGEERSRTCGIGRNWKKIATGD